MVDAAAVSAAADAQIYRLDRMRERLHGVRVARIEGGVEAAYRRQIEAASDPDALRAELEEKLSSLRSPFLTAEAFGIEEIIDPRETRPLLIDWVRRAFEIVSAESGPKARGLRP